MIWLPILGAISEATGTTLERINLKTKALNYKNYTVYGFLAIVLLMIPFILFFWEIKSPAYELKNILIFLVVIISSLFANILTFYALERKSLSVITPIRITQPLFTILLATLLFSSERKISIVILAIIASVTLMIAHLKKQELKYDKYLLAALFGSLFFAIELVASKPLLELYSSFALYFLRCLILFLITLLVFRPKNHLKIKTKLIILLIGGIWIFYRIILYYGYKIYGVVFTTILFILAPIFIFAFAKIFLKEKITKKQIISTIIVLICVIVSIIIYY